jgi:hypothetical protein
MLRINSGIKTYDSTGRAFLKIGANGTAVELRDFQNAR